MPNNATLAFSCSARWRRRAEVFSQRPGVTPASWSGTVTAGLTLTAAVGTWAPAGASYEYQWFRDGQPIPGAEASTYLVTAADEGHNIDLAVAAVGTSDGPLIAVAR